MSGIRICLVVPSLQAGGMERVMSEIASYFSSKNYLDLHLVLYDLTREIFYSVPESITIYKPDFKFSNRIRLINTIRTFIFLRTTIKKINPDSVLSFGEYWNSLVLLSLKGLPYPVYISDRCSPEKKFSTLHGLLRKLLYPKTAGIIAQTEKAKEIYFSQFRHRNIRVIGNPIRSIPVTDTNIRENIVLSVGRWISTKHQDKLIELFLKINLPGWKLVLVGYDHLNQKVSEHLMQVIEDNNGYGKVLLKGRQSDVDSYYRLSKIFAFTSSSEGFPNVIGEAMSASVPVVAFDCIAGPSEMINDGYNGYLVPLFNYIQFKDKLEYLMKDEEKRVNFGKQAAMDIQQFSTDKIGEKYLQFILKGNLKN